jgi:hypothetical protein
MDWMYQGGMVAKAEANKRVEEQQAAQPAQPSNVSVRDHIHVFCLPLLQCDCMREASHTVWR